MPAADSVALHRWARQQRSRTIGDVIARALSALAAWTGMRARHLATPSTKRNPRADVIESTSIVLAAMKTLASS